MSPEKQTKGLKSQKQKIIVGAIVFVVLIVLWQFMSLSGSGESAAPTAANRSKQVGAPMRTTVSTMTNAPVSTSGMTQDINQPRQASIPSTVELQKLQQTQAEYISALNKLQMLKLQKEIDEAKTAIATAELNRMTAEKNIADLITSKQDVALEPLLPSGNAMAQSHPPVIMPSAPAEFPYSVLSIAYGRKWTAVISGNGKLYTVGVGDVLPADNSKVIEINKEGVRIKKANVIRALPIVSTLG